MLITCHFVPFGSLQLFLTDQAGEQQQSTDSSSENEVISVDNNTPYCSYVIFSKKLCRGYVTDAASSFFLSTPPMPVLLFFILADNSFVSECVLRTQGGILRRRSNHHPYQEFQCFSMVLSHCVDKFNSCCTS